jgi:TPR repeat protein
MQTPMMTSRDSAILGGTPSTEQFFKLGIMYSTGESVATDMVSAHKLFNLAAMSGYKDGARLRHEITAEMSEADIMVAQRAARDWLAREHKAGTGIPEAEVIAAMDISS